MVANKMQPGYLIYLKNIQNINMSHEQERQSNFTTNRKPEKKTNGITSTYIVC